MTNITYDHNMFVVQATGMVLTNSFLFHFRNKKPFFKECFNLMVTTPRKRKMMQSDKAAMVLTAYLTVV
jgi:hypothetical protein